MSGSSLLAAPCVFAHSFRENTLSPPECFRSLRIGGPSYQICHGWCSRLRIARWSLRVRPHFQQRLCYCRPWSPLRCAVSPPVGALTAQLHWLVPLSIHHHFGSAARLVRSHASAPSAFSAVLAGWSLCAPRFLLSTAITARRIRSAGLLHLRRNGTAPLGCPYSFSHLQNPGFSSLAPRSLADRTRYVRCVVTML